MNKEYLVYKLADKVKVTSRIDSALFQRYGVKRGLRNEDGSGVLVGLTNIGNVVGYERQEDGHLMPVEGRLYYRGYELKEITRPVLEEGRRFGYEETAYLLLSGDLPDQEELESFSELLNSRMALDHRSLVHIIDLEGSNIMNILSRCVLEMYTFDPTPDDGSRDNQMRQAVDLIAKFPTIIAYAYNCYRHSVQGKGLHIRHPKEGLSLAENFLWMLRGEYTPMEARMLDLLMITQAEHGGGNNSTFTVRVTSSTQTDIYSSIAAGIGSLKGRLHGGANMMVADMFRYLRRTIKNWEDVEEIDQHLLRMLRGEAYDGSGLIYGLGHAVYTLSDPRAMTLKRMAGELAHEKGFEREFEFLKRIEDRGISCIQQVHGKDRPICANLDFYSGFIYEMIGIPLELYTPIFAMSRIVGWCAHRLEELNFEDRRIIRPAYIHVGGERKYKPIGRR
ncbi:MAG: citrate synthase [Bacteroidales bacterium]|nr:citrate synthase [Bacteroidales bacterium]